MGWASGSSILADVWRTVRPHVPEKDRVEILAELMEVFASRDCDTLNELIGLFPEAEAAYDLHSS